MSAATSGPVPGVAGPVALLRWAARRLNRYRVQGRSMWPTLPDGRTVLVDPRAYRRRAPQPGDLVLVQHPGPSARVMVKRVSDVTEGGVFVVGDNAPESTDSRHFGRLPLRLVLGRVECFFV